MIQLGQKAKDVITGFKGTVTGKVTYISGCNQVLLTPEAGKDGSYKSAEWFDEQRVRSLGGSILVLDNERTPGADKAAPKR